MKAAFIPTLAATFITAAAGLSAPAFAVDEHHDATPAQAPADAQMVEAVVKKVDKSAGKATLSHGPLPNLGMPAMTMVFRVKDAAMLDKVKTGDKVKFKAEKVQGDYTVTELAPAK